MQYNAAVSSVPASDEGHPALGKLRDLCNESFKGAAASLFALGC